MKKEWRLQREEKTVKNRDFKLKKMVVKALAFQGASRCRIVFYKSLSGSKKLYDSENIFMIDQKIQKFTILCSHLTLTSKLLTVIEAVPICWETVH